MKPQFLFVLVVSFNMHFMCNCLIRGTAQLTHYESYARCCPKNPNYDPRAPKGECNDFSAW